MAHRIHRPLPSASLTIDQQHPKSLFYQQKRQFPHSLVLMIIDIKKFQRINTLYGYAAGDEILRQVYAVLQKHRQKEEALFRLAEDQFLFFLHDETNEITLERLLVFDREIYQLHYQGQWLRLLLSFGIHRVQPGDEYQQALDYADNARRYEPDYSRYSSSYEFSSPAIQDPITQRAQIETWMHPALDKPEFVVFIQPKIGLNDGRIDGGEALIRWYHEGVQVPLHVFLPIFVQNTFIRKIDQLVFDQLCQCFTRWLDQGLPVVPISCNLSRPSFMDSEYLSEILTIFNRYALPQSLFEFELSEEIELNNEVTLLDSMQDIQKRGFSCSLDDFGSGYSSLSLLSSLPVSTIKLDRSFFNEPLNEKKQIVLRELLTILHGLGMQTVAEGVESQEYIDFLRTHGCDFVQGFYYSTPVPIPEFERMLIQQPFLHHEQSTRKDCNVKKRAE